MICHVCLGAPRAETAVAQTYARIFSITRWLQERYVRLSLRLEAAKCVCMTGYKVIIELITRLGKSLTGKSAVL